MAKFRFVGRDINIHWNGYDIVGPAGTVFSIPDQLYEEFESDLRGAEPTLEWIDTNEFLTLTNAVSVTTLQGTFPISVTTTTSGKIIGVTSSSAADGYVLTSDGSGGVAWEALPGDATGITSIIGTSPISAAVAATQATISIDQSLITGAAAATNAQTVRTYVKNTTGSSIAKGSAVYVSGATGDNALIALSTASTEVGSSKTLGITSEAIANDAFGYVVESGYITGIDTSGVTAGTPIWLGTTPGSLVYGSPPAEPNHSVYLGVVIREQQNNGSILVKVQNGYELDELHDVSATNPTDLDILQYKNSSGLWTKTSISNAGIPTLSSTAAIALGTASAGVATSASRQDHVHPTTGLSTISGTETLTNKTLTAPKFANAGFIADANGNELIEFANVASAVNAVKVTNSSAGNPPSITAVGTDTNIDLVLDAKGTGFIEATDSGIRSVRAATTDTAFAAKVSGDSSSRLIVRADGRLTWGSGEGAGTTNLYAGTDVLVTDDSLLLTAGGLTLSAGNITVNAQGDLRLGDSDSSNWVALQAPATVSSNVTLTLPATAGSSGQALTTNGSGTLSWSSIGLVSSTTLTGSGTWVIPTGVQYLRAALLVRGGSGGDSGRARTGTASGNASEGGASGSGGAGTYFQNIYVGDLTSMTYSVGAGGAGGAAVSVIKSSGTSTTTNTAGNSGAAGAHSTLGSFLTSNDDATTGHERQFKFNGGSNLSGGTTGSIAGSPGTTNSNNITIVDQSNSIISRRENLRSIGLFVAVNYSAGISGGNGTASSGLGFSTAIGTGGTAGDAGYFAVQSGGGGGAGGTTTAIASAGGAGWRGGSGGGGGASFFRSTADGTQTVTVTGGSGGNGIDGTGCGGGGGGGAAAINTNTTGFTSLNITATSGKGGDGGDGTIIIWW